VGTCNYWPDHILSVGFLFSTLTHRAIFLCAFYGLFSLFFFCRRSLLREVEVKFLMGGFHELCLLLKIKFSFVRAFVTV
jgi:hypothetical protein